MSDDPRARALFIASVVLSTIGLLLLIWWWFGVHRWWTVVVGALAAISGVAIAARARREPEEPSP